MKRWSTALTATMREHGDELLSYAATLVGPGFQELLEDALVAAFGGLRPPESTSEARHAVARALRRGAVRRDDAGPGQDDAGFGRDDARRGGDERPDDDAGGESPVREGIRALATRERAVLAMRLVDGLAVESIAAATGLREAEAREALSAAVTRLAAAGVRIDARDALEGGRLEGESTVIGGAA